MENRFESEVEKSLLENVTDEQEKEALVSCMDFLRGRKLNILFTGATGVGKSSTIDALFRTEVARIGRSVNPETKDIRSFELDDNLTLWDTPGLGDDPSKDQGYARQIANALREKDEQGNLLIDAVVVVLDAGSRDMRTSFELIEKVIIPYLGDSKRLVVAINQCDRAMSGRNWNPETCMPEPRLQAYLLEQAESVKKRILQSTGVQCEPIAYSALYRYNLSRLLLAVIQSVPEEKRYLMAGSLRDDPAIWKSNDTLAAYNEHIQKEMKGSMTKALRGAAEGAGYGAIVGSFIPAIGSAIGAVIGAALGFLGGFM